MRRGLLLLAAALSACSGRADLDGASDAAAASDAGTPTLSGAGSDWGTTGMDYGCHGAGDPCSCNDGSASFEQCWGDGMPQCACPSWDRSCPVRSLYEGDGYCDLCQHTECCAELQACADDDAGCLNPGSGAPDPASEIGAALLVCVGANCRQFCGDVEICAAGETFSDPGLASCARDRCCPEYVACAGATRATGAECGACVAEGGGELCDDLLGCLASSACGSGLGAETATATSTGVGGAGGAGGGGGAAATSTTGAGSGAGGGGGK